MIPADARLWSMDFLGGCRHAWIALGCTGHLDALLSFSRELSSLSIGSTAVASGAGDAPASKDKHDFHRLCTDLFRGSIEDASSSIVVHHDKPRQSTSNLVTSSGLNGHLAATGASLLGNTLRAGVLGLTASPGAPTNLLGLLPISEAPIGCRLYHGWYYGSKLRSYDIKAASTVDQLWALLRRHGAKMDHVNLVALLRQLHVVAKSSPSSAAAAAPRPARAAGAAGPSSKAVAAAVTASSSRVSAKELAALVQEVTRLVKKRTKWFDPRYAAEVVDVTANLGYTDIRMLYDMTERTLARLNEAYSKDLMVLLRGLNRHSRLTTATANAGGQGQLQLQQQQQQQQPTQLPAAFGNAAVNATAVKPNGKSGQTLDWRLIRWWYGGPTVGLLEGVERFMLAKIPTGKMAPENIDGLLRYVLELPHMNRPINPKVLKAVENDLRERIQIYAPKPLAGVLESLVEARHPLPPDMLDSAVNQFMKHGEKHGTGNAAARLLDAVGGMIKIGGSKGASPGRWLSSRPDLLTLCLRLMARDLPAAQPERLAELMSVLVRVEVPLASLAAKATTPGAGVSAVTPTSPAPAAAADAAAAGTNAAAAGFIRAHKTAVEAVSPRLSKDVASKLRRSFALTTIRVRTLILKIQL
ncbi:hypothetical protein VOLCADRAFT_91472 [Volvox carteri f. nagariensis]|uniref:Uncharacterized protein n=1 Tax=Volvox carteri f. nagariensis TaxID=3068 RepID=D8TX59_VOLCA|nr:uncharacterized protein VOLCADRAFT_91472 [Volvox carteri f. nagariensis]EFJ47850.1 hypothetical protein VOLCADRAFT_91472 [Volvox carteri f. nagariensis]|eukprot:XP_002950956.1 hypothetical protein VOLCADRAFT_91472 [Volvox carteri f. nagariensis]